MLEILTTNSRVIPEQLLTPAQDTYCQFTWNSPSGPKFKSALISPVKQNDWAGISREDAEGVFIFTVRVQTLDEGMQIFQSLVPRFGISKQIEERNNPGGDFKNYKADGVFTGNIWNSHRENPLKFARSLPASEGTYELVIEFNRSVEGKSTAAYFYNSLVRSTTFAHQAPCWDRQLEFDFSSNAGRRDWGYFTYYDWASKLTSEERRALQILGGPDYREIQQVMRQEEAAYSDSRVIKWSRNITNAIERGATDREITVYRATTQPSIEKWDALNKGLAAELDHSDKGFLITTLDPEIARFWNRVYLNNRGVIMTLTVPKRTPSAFLDAEGVLTDRGYLELVFRSNQKMVLNEAVEAEDGQKYLKGRLENLRVGSFSAQEL